MNSLLQLQALVGDIQAQAYAQGTLRNLRSQWKAFIRFCREFQLVPLPASSSTISCFLVYLSQRTSSYRYILNHMNSIRIFHLYYDLPYGALSSFSVLLTTMGLKRLLGTHTNQKHPVTLEMLRRIYGLLDTSIASQSALWCLFLVAFFSFIRKSNLTAPSAQAFDPEKHLTREDIKFTSQGAFLRIRWSKTRQHREGILLVPLPLIPDSELCPVTAIRHYFSLVPAPPRSPFFCVPHGRCLSPLTSYTFANTFKKLVSVLGLDPRNYSPHSFRRGGATYAFQAGVPDHLIQIHGDWRSDAYKLYLALPLSTRTQVADTMAAGLYQIS